MANFVFVEAFRAIGNKEIEFDADDFRVLLYDGTSTIVTEKTKNTLSGFTTLGELSGTGYTRKALASESWTEDNVTNFLCTFDADDVTWTAINAGTIVGALIFKHVTNDSDSVPIFNINSGFPVTTNGSDFTLRWNASGIMRMKTA